MVLAIYGGLTRLGLSVPDLAPLQQIHGPLMVLGVFGTLISLERSVAIGVAWPYGAPGCFALCAATLVFGAVDLAAVLAVGGSVFFVAASVWIAVRQRAMFTVVLALSTVSLLIGSAFWLAGAPVSAVVGWWLAFLVLTIAAERLELSRVMQPGRAARWLFLIPVILIVTGAALSIESSVGAQVLGVGFICAFAWLWRYDVARRTVRMAGQPRFMGCAMLLGYIWLVVDGALLTLAGTGPFAYDATLHAVLVGFVLSMVFGHALIIFPAITGIALRHWAPLYLPLALLHLSVLLRVSGDILEVPQMRLVSGPLTALSLVLFGALVIAGRRGLKHRSA